ncbi:MAG: hypothetical protein ACI4V4_02270 [Eubacterium sp.]
MIENKELTFDIRMQTPIGIKIGKMSITNEKGILNGYLDILKKSEPFTGTIFSDGSCRINGKIVTLMKTVAYTASGVIENSMLSLEVLCGKNKFYITGNLIS